MKPKRDLVIIICTITLAIMTFFMVFLVSEGINESADNKNDDGVSLSKHEVLCASKTVEKTTEATEVVFTKEAQFVNCAENSAISYEEYCEYYSEAWSILMLHGVFEWESAREGVSEEIAGIAYDDAYRNYEEASNAAFDDGYNQGNSDGFGDGYSAGYFDAIKDMEGEE